MSPRDQRAVRRLPRFARAGCTADSLRRCLAQQRECRACPPLPPEGLAPWLHRIGFYRHKVRAVREPEDPEVRFMRCVKKRRNGCWQWTGRVNAKGLPVFFVSRASWLAQRWAHAHWRGPLPLHRHSTTTCGNRLCVNPAHVELKVR